MPQISDDLAQQLALAERRLQRERAARKSAEQLLNEKSREVYEALEKSAQSQRLLELAMWASGESTWVWRASDDGFEQRSYPNGGAGVVMLAGTTDEFINNVHVDDREHVTLKWNMHCDGASEALDYAFRFWRDNQWRWVRVRGKAIEKDEQGRALRIVGTAKDVTEMREAEQSFRLMVEAFGSSRDAMLILKPDLYVIEANSAFYQLAGLMPIRADDLRLSDFVNLSEQDLRGIQHHGQLKQELDFNAQQQTLPVELTLSQFNAEQGHSSYLIATLRDVTERKKAERTLKRLARFDALTGLLNRRAFQQALAERLQSPQPRQLALLFIDLDSFKAVNDSCGHETGDQLLNAIAQTLRQCLPASSLFARWGGDEFVVAVDLQQTADGQGFAQQLIDAISGHTTLVQGQRLVASASIGIALAPEHGNDVELLLRNADAAMYDAKAQGKNRYALYHQGLTEEAIKRVTLISELRTAIEQKSLDFVLQGKYDAQGNCRGAELLCRWQSCLHGNVPPSVFIPLAEQNGLASAIGLLAAETAAQYSALLKGHGFDIVLAINLSAQQILQDGLSAQLASICQQHHVMPHCIELEVTESVFLQEDQDPEAHLRALSKAGFAIAMDDFGTGYSSLSYLRRFGFDVVKIDRSFVMDLEHDPRAEKLMVGIVNLCQTLGIHTVAEGVETQAQLALLREQGVTHYQGYYLGRPQPLSDFIQSLQG